MAKPPNLPTTKIQWNIKRRLNRRKKIHLKSPIKKNENPKKLIKFRTKKKDDYTVKRIKVSDKVSVSEYQCQSITISRAFTKHLLLYLHDYRETMMKFSGSLTMIVSAIGRFLRNLPNKYWSLWINVIFKKKKKKK